MQHSLLWKLQNNEIKNNETGYYTNIHFFEHFHVNIDTPPMYLKCIVAIYQPQL